MDLYVNNLPSSVMRLLKMLSTITIITGIGILITSLVIYVLFRLTHYEYDYSRYPQFKTLNSGSLYGYTACRNGSCKLEVVISDSNYCLPNLLRSTSNDLLLQDVKLTNIHDMSPDLTFCITNSSTGTKLYASRFARNYYTQDEIAEYLNHDYNDVAIKVKQYLEETDNRRNTWK